MTRRSFSAVLAVGAEACVGSPGHNGDLPSGWVASTMSALGRWSTGGTPSRKQHSYFGGSIPWVKSGDLPDGVVRSTSETITQAGLDNSAARLLPAGTLLVALYGATIGKLGILASAAATNQACAACRIWPEIESWCVFYYLLSQRDALVEAGQGGAQPNLTNDIVRNWPLPLPPLAEQKRIVAKVEKLLARVNAARARLAKVPALLKRFRQSVLAAVCAGRLTEEWRNAHHAEEDARTTLRRISEDRRASQLGTGQRRPAESDVESEELHELPGTWAWATLNQIGQEGRPVIYGIIKPGPHVPNGVPYVRVMEMRDGTIDVPNLRRASKERAARFSRATLEAGDLLISKDGTIGRVAVVPPELTGGNITQHLVRAAIHRFVERSYVVMALRSPVCQKWLTEEKLGVALQGVNVEDFRRLPLPIPPVQEQRALVRRVGALFADKIEARVQAATARVEKITQAILAKAFRGELVPTEAELARREGRDYEPASVLLERIRAARDGVASTRRTRTVRRASTSASAATNRKSARTASTKGKFVR